MQSWSPKYRRKRQSRAPGRHCKKTTLEPVQSSLNRTRLRPRRLPQKQWLLSQDYQVVMDKQLMQYLPFLKRNWRTLSVCSKFLSQHVQTYGYVFHDTNGPNHRKALEIPWYFLTETCMVTHQLVQKWERQFEEALSELGLEEIANWDCMFAHRKQGLFLSENVDDIKVTGKKQTVAPMWKKLMKHVDTDEPTSFLDHVDLGVYSA